MKFLIVEDDFITRKILKNMLKKYALIDIAVNGKEALEAFNLAHEEKSPYDVIFLDILMPKMNGQEVLKNIRKIEENHNIYGKESVKIVMTTVLSDIDSIITAFREQCEAYIIKPINQEDVINSLKKILPI